MDRRNTEGVLAEFWRVSDCACNVAASLAEVEMSACVCIRPAVASEQQGREGLPL